MKELKYLDVATAELIKNKITDACELLKNSPASPTPAVPYWTPSLQQTSVYIQLPCLYDVLIGHEIKSIVDDTMTALNEKNALAGVFTLHCIRTRELYELDKDGNEYMTGEDFNAVNISMQYHTAPTISQVLKTIENNRLTQGFNRMVLPFQYVEGVNKGHVVGIIESAIKALADGSDYNGFKFTLTTAPNVKGYLANPCGPAVYGDVLVNSMTLTIENTNKVKDPLGIETIFEYTIGDDANE